MFWREAKKYLDFAKIQAGRARADLRAAEIQHPVEQQRYQSSKDNQQKNRCGDAGAWSGKIKKAGNVIEQAGGVDKNLLTFYNRGSREKYELARSMSGKKTRSILQMALGTWTPLPGSYSILGLEYSPRLST